MEHYTAAQAVRTRGWEKAACITSNPAFAFGCDFDMDVDRATIAIHVERRTTNASYAADRFQRGSIFMSTSCVAIGAMIPFGKGAAMRAEQLTAEFGISGVVDFIETEHGLVKAAISLGGMVGELYLQGAQVTAWQPPGERPILFTSPNAVFAPGRAIRGGIPIIFPWFGPNRHVVAAPQHGFARTAMWHLDGIETAGTQSLTLTLNLGDGDVGSRFWPEPFRAIYTVTFAQTLSLRLAVQNRATHPIVFEQALHSYFAVSDIVAVGISGLAGATYIDKTQAGRRQRETAPLVTIGAETDRVYLDTSARCAIEDRGWRRNVFVEKIGAPSTVVWNPWAEKGAAMADLGDPAWRGMICVETGNVADNELRLAASDEHQMSATISVAAKR